MDKNAIHRFEYAKNDLDAAIILSEQQKPKVEIICYHCQQCAEKMLKGYIALRNGRLLKTHDLVVLCETCSEYDISFQNILETCSNLTIFSSEVRYPNTLEIELHHAKNAINDAVLIKDFVLCKL